MPVEHLRQRFAQDINLYPDLAPRRRSSESPSVISIASTSSASSSSSIPPRAAGRALHKAIVISDDEESTSGDSRPPSFVNESNPSKLAPLQRAQDINSRRLSGPESLPSSKVDISKFPPPANMAKPIHIPSNRDILPSSVPTVKPLDGELLNIPDFKDDVQYMSPADAEKALRDLMGSSVNEDTEAAINPEDATVNGFRENIQLLPHQIIGRHWMRDREDATKKRTGGILADDMGLGKTIQTLTRIVEGRPRKQDRVDGWAAATLVICPLALVGQWADEIEKMAEGLVVIKHHGPSRTSNPDALRKSHVVVTTYDVVKSEYEAHSRGAKNESKKSGQKSKSAHASDEYNSDSSGERFGRTIKSKKNKKDALFQVRWWRIVLDEAHNIKNEKTKGAIACCQLEGKFRWCLTGTPMQNNVVELYSLFKFLRIKPLSVWDTFNSQIAQPVKTGKGANRAMKRLQVVLKQVMLRRRKDQIINGKPLLKLPKRDVQIVSCDFDSSEKEFYTGLENKMESVIRKLLSQQEKQSQYMSVLLLLLRLRQACNHPVLVTDDYKQDIDAVEPNEKNSDTRDDDGDDLADAFRHLGVTRKCKVCTVELTPENIGAREWDSHCVDCVPLAREAMRARQGRPSSAKIRMVLKLLRGVHDRSGKEKTIIFSQFTKMLDLIEPFLTDEGFKYVRYDGSMDAKAREKSLAEIRNNASIRIILISFKAGSTGLNLTACNNVILVDLWWNPALEDQAFDRAHRLGQTRDVHIFKLKIDDTVEDRILNLQEKKRELAKAALSGDKVKGMKLGMEDLLALFRSGGRDDEDED